MCFIDLFQPTNQPTNNNNNTHDGNCWQKEKQALYTNARLSKREVNSRLNGVVGLNSRLVATLCREGGLTSALGSLDILPSQQVSYDCPLQWQFAVQRVTMRREENVMVNSRVFCVLFLLRRICCNAFRLDRLSDRALRQWQTSSSRQRVPVLVFLERLRVDRVSSVDVCEPRL
mgnify:CR=1 FL=1